MRIVQYIAALGSGGKERQVIELLKGLSAYPGIECELVVMAERVHFDYLKEINIKTHVLLRKSKKDLGIFFQFYKLMKERRPDIIHSWDSMCSVYALPAVKLLGIHFVNGFLRDAPPSLTFKDKDWLRSHLTFPFSHAIVANSQAGLVAYNAPPEKSFCVHNGFDFKRISCLTDPAEIRRKFEITTDKVVGMVAGFYPRKDYALFLEAAQHILQQRDDTTFVAVGGGDGFVPLQNDLPAKYKKRIKFLGRQKQVEAIVNMFTVGVLTSNAYVHGEGISNAIMEYMALGKPVLATNAGGNCELIKDGETGFLLENSSVEDLSNRVTQLLDDASLATRLGEAGRNRLIQDFNLDNMTKKYLKLYKGIL